MVNQKAIFIKNLTHHSPIALVSNLDIEAVVLNNHFIGWSSSSLEIFHLMQFYWT